jgi:hypothetical protein
LQTPVDDARSKGHKEVGDMIDKFQVYFGSFIDVLKCLFNQIAHSSITFQDNPVKYFCFNLIVFSSANFKEIKEPDVV